MHFLLTNDDGIEAEGLAALRAAVEPLGHTTVVAPRTGHSGCGHAVTYQNPIEVAPTADPRLGEAYACDGTPADCVRLALKAMDAGPFDWVVAGVNQGANLGVDTFYSGTVAAVREAAILGCRGIAVSQFTRRDVEIDWARVSGQVTHLLRQLVEAKGGQPQMWNVNLPVGGQRRPGLQVTPLSYDPLPMQYEPTAGSSAEAVAYRYCGRYPERLARPGTDVAATLGGDISVSPLNLDGVDTASLTLRLEAPALL